MTETQKLNLAELEANAETQKHINVVRVLLREAAVELLKRGELHDLSKLVSPEVSMFAEYTSKLRGTTFGSPEYNQYLTEMGPALEHHYKNNKHHPQFYPNGIEGMNLIDLLEMMIDWLASTKRHADGDIMRSIEYNSNRFGINPQLTQILRNTAEEMLKTSQPSCAPNS
jgi:hypothetical protein